MDNMNEVFDVKVTNCGTLHTLTSIKELLGQTACGKQEQNNDVCPPIRYKIGNNHFEFEPLKKVRVSEVLEVIRSPERWSALSDEDSWKKDPLVIPRGLAWSKIGKFEKGDYGSLFTEWSNPILSMAPTSTELLQPWLIRNMDYFLTLLVDGQPNDPINASPQGIQQNICDIVVHDPQFEQQTKQVVESVLVFTSDELVAEYHSITISVQLIENVEDGDPSIVLKELVVVKQQMNAIERFIKSRNDNLLEDYVAKQSVEKEIESSDRKAISPDSAISDVFIGEITCENLVQEQLQSRDMCIQSIGNQFVQQPLESPNGKRPEITISDVLNGEVSFDKKRPNIYHGESSKIEALSKEFDPKEYDKNVSESEIINVLTGEVSCDKCVGGFYDGESSKLYYTDPKEYPSSSMTQLLQAAEYAGFDFDNTDMVKTGEEEIHLDGLKIVDDPFVQTHDKQNSEEMSLYVNEENVVNKNQPPSSEKVVGQLLRQRFVRKALVEPYTMQPPTTAPSGFGKRRKRKAMMLQTKNTLIYFDDEEDYDDVGDDDPDFLVISLEEWVYTSWLNLLGLNDDGWLSDKHLDAWFELMWSFRPTDADWAIASSYFCGFVMRGDIPGWACNGISLYYKCGLEVFEVKDDDDVQFFVNEVCGQSEIVQKLFVKKIKEQKQVKFVVPPVNDFDLNVSLFPNDYNNQTDNLPKWQLNTFTHMPIPPPPPQPYIKKSRVKYHGISVGDDFANKNECMYTIGVKSLREAFQYAVIKSCPLSNRVYKVKDIQHDMRVDWKIDISYKRTWGGRNMALQILNGSHEYSFSQLSYYCYNLKLANEGIATHIYTDADVQFEMLYVGFGFAIKSFLRYMRPLIIIDRAHLKGNYLGINLLAVGMDGNNQIIPLATSVSQGETSESWTWFLTKLKEQIGEPPNLCIISDRHAAIIQACGTIFDNLFHGFCDCHLMMNCNLKGKKLRGIFWKACKAYTTEDFDKAISKLRGHRPEAVRKLEEAGFEKCTVETYCKGGILKSDKNTKKHLRSSFVIGPPQKSANWTVRPMDHLKLFQVFNKREVHQQTKRCKSIRTNSLHQTPTWEEHLSEEARKVEERLRNGRVYMDWYDVEASQEPITTKGMGVKDGKAVQWMLDSYNPCINFLSQADNDNYYQSQPQFSIQSNNQQLQPESVINYHFFHLDDM
ncbi:transposase, MuDR, MULE transposase domain protein [Tanacetum coccineum]